MMAHPHRSHHRTRSITRTCGSCGRERTRGEVNAPPTTICIHSLQRAWPRPGKQRFR